MTTPRSNATIYDTIKIGGVDSPGICTVPTIAFRKTEFDIQGRPGFIGKVAVPKGQEIVRRTYRFTMWEDDHFARWDIMQTRLEKARRAKPRPEYVEVIDPRLKGMTLTKFLVEGWSEEIQVDAGKWARDVMLIEHVKLAPIPRLPANKAVQDEFKADAEKATAERLKAEAEYKASLAQFKTDSAPVAASFASGWL